MVSVADPLNIVLQCRLENESRQEVGYGLQGHLAMLHARGFTQAVVYMDLHSTFKAMTLAFPGVEINVGSVGDYVPKVDAKICQIKEMYQKIKAGLPWQVPQVLVRDLIAYVVSWLNIRRTQALSGNVCP